MTKNEYGWLNLKASVHAKCPTPFLWTAKPGQRWRCGRKLDNGERCGRTYVVGQNPTGKRVWVEEPAEQVDTELARFRRVTDEELWYWLTDELELRSRDQDVCAETLIEVIRKHFEIGSKQ